MMKQLYYLSVLVVAIVATGFSVPVAAQEMPASAPDHIESQIDEEFKWLQEEAEFTVEIATKTAKKVDDAPGKITVISKKHLRRRNIITVDDALTNLTGVFVKRTRGLMDSGDAVAMRGFNNNEYSLVLLDGQPINDGYTGGVKWSALSIASLEKIEVMRGAASSLYGGNAMGGVINMITHTPDEPGISALGGYGTHDTWRCRFNAGHHLLRKLSLSIGYELETTDGYVDTPVARTIKLGEGTLSGGYLMNDKYGEPGRWVVGDRGDHNGKRENINAKAHFDFSDTGYMKITAVSGHQEYDYDPPNTYMGTFSGSAIAGPGQKADFSPNDFFYGGIGENDTDVYAFSAKESFGKTQLYAHVGMTKTSYFYTVESGGSKETYYDSPGTLTEIESDTLFSEIHLEIPVGKKHNLMTGASFRQDESDTNDYDIPYYRSDEGKSTSILHSRGRDEIWAIFLEDEWKITEPLTLYLGCRYDSWRVREGSSGKPGAETEYESNTDSDLSPRTALVWRAFSDTIFRASVGHAFRPPNLYELYRTRSTRSTNYQGNPMLKPETVWTYETGVDQYLFHRRTRLSLTGYQNEIDNLIYYKDDKETKTKTRMNAGKARTFGLEAEASHNIFSWLNLWGNLTYTDAKIRENPLDPDSEDQDVTMIPKTMWNIGLDVKHDKFEGSFTGRYFSKIHNDSDNRDIGEGVYGTYEPAFYLDGKITFMPCKWAELSLSANNLLDEEYYEYYKQDGRTFLFEVTMKY